MKCAEFDRWLPEWLFEEDLQESLRVELESHRDACDRCRADSESLKTLWVKLEDLSMAAPVPDMQSRFQSMLQSYRAGMESGRRSPDWKNWIPAGSFWRPALQFAAAAALVVVGFFAGHTLTMSDRNQEELHTLRGEVRSMQQLVTLSLLQQQSASERLRGITWSHRIARPDVEVVEALLQTLRYDPNVNVRLAAIDALSQLSTDSQVRDGLLQALPRQESPLVQIALIDLIVSIREKRSLSTLREMIDNENVHQAVRERAELGVKELS